MSQNLDEWIANINKMNIKRSEINLLIMEYLISEGCKEAAESFKTEANIDFDMNENEETEEQIDRRIAVRSAIESGKIQTALELINNYYPELIDNHRHLYFKLQQQQLIELIRNHEVEKALQFAQGQLGVDNGYLHLNELERTLSLLAFENPENSPYADLLQPAHRQHLASRINETLLKEQTGRSETPTPKLVTLLKLLPYTQNELETKKVKFIKLVDLPQGTFAPNGN
ncbi:Glucose-induced degradation complex subunit [Dermatophagoides farinae]|uniref:C20orf11-like protein n=1 Tax=Dermatophagoides farinae TaxID=6954 RepID=A0A922I1Q0_DERFA|nr:c20orf11-like protein [Dermatophagoides farinae]KAH9516923.1 Glucose-induced degradation complex subunit [Dermatophagoides farinae]